MGPRVEKRHADKTSAERSKSNPHRGGQIVIPNDLEVFILSPDSGKLQYKVKI